MQPDFNLGKRRQVAEVEEVEEQREVEMEVMREDDDGGFAGSDEEWE